MAEISPHLPLTPTVSAQPRRLGLKSLWTLAARQWWRDLRSGDLRLMLVAITLAVAALSAVGFLADRLQSGLALNALNLLGGDAVVVADEPVPPTFEAQARGLGLRTAGSALFTSMARATPEQGGAVRLVMLKAVSPSYPLYGELGAAPERHRPAQARAHGPAPGEVWAEPAVLDVLGLKVGDPLLLGEARLRIGAVLLDEPDRGAGFLSFAPRVMLAQADLPQTGLIQPASRVTWRLFVAGADERARRSAVQAYTTRIQEDIDRQALRGIRIETLDNARPEMRQTLDRAGRFLQLVAVLAAVLAAVAVGIAARQFAQRHLDTCALLRVMGLPQRHITAIHGLELLGVGLLAGTLGVALGAGVHLGLVALLGDLVGTPLPAPSWRPAAIGLGVALVLLAAFGLPPVLQLARVPALRVLRRDLGDLRPASLTVALAGAAGYGGLLLATTDLKLGGLTLGGFAAAWALFAGVTWLTVAALRRWALPAARRTWTRLTLRSLTARPGVAVLQASALALGLMALMLLVLIRTDLIAGWRAATPANAPDRFVINIQPDQDADFQRTLHNAGVTDADRYPMFRGRLVSVNGRPVKPDDYPTDQARRLVDREFNLSHSDRLPAHNEIESGRWTPEEPDALSVESGLAQTLGLRLGDRLGFDVAGQIQEARITSLRKLSWTSMRVNFFVMFPRREMPDMPVSMISAYRQPSGSDLDRTLATRFPNLTVIDVSAQIRQVQGVLDQVIRAMESLFAFTLAAGVLVLLAALTTTRQERVREYALLRALGAGRSLLGRVQQAELVGLGALAGALAALAAGVTTSVLATRVFDFVWTPPWWLLPSGLGLGALLALVAGWWGLRGVLKQPPAVTLRQSEP